MAIFSSHLRGNLARGSVIVAVMLVSDITFFHGEMPPLAARPAMAEARVRGIAAEPAISTRLWQDPLAAIEESFDRSIKQDFGTECAKPASGGGARQSPLTEKENEALVIGVMLPGEANAQDAEPRKRTRFAVLAGLARTGFDTKNSSHVDYFLWQYPASDNRPSAISVRSQSTVPAFIEETAAVAGTQETVIPYEWFDEASQQFQADKKRILVLWLNEDVFRGEPLRKLSGLKRFLFADDKSNVAVKNLKLIGPYSSKMLRDMVDETRKFNYAPPYDKAFGQLPGHANSPELNDVQFYAYGATAADDQLPGDLSQTYGTVERLFEALGLHLRRTIATDRALARSLVGELKRRKIGVGFSGADIALISEWDGYYGQSLPKAVARALGHTRPGGRYNQRDGYDPDWIHNLTYLRGLDGQALQAGNLEEAAGTNETAQGEKQIGGKSIFKIQSDARSLDQSLGQARADYLRRISEELHELDGDLRREKRGIKAIGVLGQCLRQACDFACATAAIPGRIIFHDRLR